MTTSIHKPHRKVWHDHYGDIPLDENGVTFEIHHINSDHNDNRIDNLLCLSIEDHYQLHYEQGDYYACASLLKRIKHNVDVFEGKQSDLIYAKENHPMYGKNHSEEARSKISKNHSNVKGDNNPMFGRSHSEESIRKMKEGKKGQGLGIPKSEETKLRMSQAVKHKTCPHCGKTAKGNSMFRWHFDNCKQKQTGTTL